MSGHRHQRLHLDTHSGRFLAWNADTREEESFSLRAECQADKDKPASEILSRHLADGGAVTVDTFGSVGFADKLKPADKEMLEVRAKEINGADSVDFGRVIRARWSLGTPNRSQIVVPNSEWNLEPFNNSNPVGAWGHRTSFSGPEMIIARWLFTGHATKSKKSDLIGFEEFAPHDVNPLASTVLGLYKFGALNAFSPGFLIGEAEFKDDEEGTVVFTGNELVELSNVPVGRHADAVIMALSDGAVEIGPLRELITAQLEVAYSDPMQLMETARFEAIAKKLGLVGSKTLVEMTTEQIEALDPPHESPGLNALTAHALRTRELQLGAEALLVDGDAWARFLVATAPLEEASEPSTDQAILFAALGAGLAEEAKTFRLVLAEEAAAVPGGSTEADQEAEDPPEENAAPDVAGEPETNESDPPEGSGDVPQAVTVEAFALAVAAGLEPFKADIEKKRGRLILS